MQTKIRHHADVAGSLPERGARSACPVTVIDGRWPFAGRDAEVARIRSVLGEHSVQGVVLLGPSGIGKTTIAQHVLTGLPHHFDHIYLRGSAAHATTPYGALNVLLAELDEDTARNPLLVLSALQRFFDGHGGSKRQTLMHIDGVEDIDELSATVIAHLARVGAVRLLVTCEDLLRAPSEFLDLWKDNVLARFDIKPLDLENVTEVLAAALGAPVSRSAARALWAASGGNPRYLQVAAKSDVVAGHLFLRDGVWVSRDAPRPESGRSVADWITTKLAALTAVDRAVVEVLAVVGRVPMATLLRAVPSSALDDLQHHGVVSFEPDRGPLVRLTYEVVADVVRGGLLSSAGRDALVALSALRDDAAMPVQSRVALALWSLDQGDAIGSDELLTLARLANDYKVDAAATRFLDALPPSEHGSAVLLERTRALHLDGHMPEASATVEKVLKRKSEDTPLPEWVRARLFAAELRVRSHGHDGRAQPLIDEVVARLALEPSQSDVAGLRAQTDLLRMELHAFEGEFDLVREMAVRALTEWPEETVGNIRVRNLLGLAHATLGSQEQGIAMVADVVARLANSPSGPLDREAAVSQLYSVLLLAGHWTESLEFAAGHGYETESVLLAGSPSEFAEGVLLAYLGRSHEALEKLVPAISQFRIRDRHGLLPLAEAAAAYAAVLENDPDAAEDHLRAVDLTGQRYPWHLREAVRYFTLLTEAWLGTADVIATEFLERGVELGERGFHGVELFFLGQAVQLGRHEAADRLAASAAAGEGPFAELSGDFARGVLSRDPAVLKEVARSALDNGNYNLAGDVAAQSIECLSDSDDPMIRVHAEQILRKTSTPARRHVRRKLLSERERAIARMVARGVANKDIAQQEHISPRTVEGHVHQIMSKLGLSSRKQLALIFGQQQ